MLTLTSHSSIGQVPSCRKASSKQSNVLHTRLSRSLIGVACAVALASAGTPAFAQNLVYITGRVTTLEPTYMPNRISLQMDAGSPACPRGKWLSWEAGTAGAPHIQAVYATLMAALLDTRNVTFVVYDSDVNCVGRYLHLR
jgi:hypothetical protein